MSTKKIIIVLVALLIAVIGMALAQVSLCDKAGPKGPVTPQNPTPSACTFEAMFCSDGSSVGRNPERNTIRRHVTHLDIDRPLFNDHNAMKALVQSGEILEAVERAVGALG